MHARIGCSGTLVLRAVAGIVGGMCHICYLIVLVQTDGARETSKKSKPASSRVTMREIEIGVAGRVIYIPCSSANRVLFGV